MVRGRVAVDGVDVTSRPAYERARMGVMLAHQNPPPLRYVRGRVLVEELSRLYGLDRGEALELAESLGVRHLVDRPLFYGFSGGERKRMELYLSLLTRPRYLLLDEPDSGVDPDTVKAVIAAVEAAVARGAGVLLVSHNLYTLELLASRGDPEALVMVSGRIAWRGRLSRLLPEVRERGFSLEAGSGKA